MASAAIEAIVEEIIEEIIEAAVQQGAEAAAEDAIEQVVENAVEEVVDDAVENVVEEEVEQVVEQEVEQVVEEAVEENVENAVEDAEEGFWKNMLKEQVLPGVIAGLTTGLVLLGITKAIDASKSDKDSGNSEETDAGQKAAATVLSVVDEVNKRWKAKLEEYQKSGEDLGTFQFNGEAKDAARTIGALVTNLNTELNAAKDIAVKSTADKSWNENIDEFKWRVANSCEDLLAVFAVKKTGDKLKKLDFPPASDEEAINNVLNKEMPNYKAIIKEEVQKHLSAAVSSLARNKAINAVKTLIREPLSTKIKSGFNTEVRPDALKAAKDAAKAETTIVMNSYMHDINLHAAIPIYGISTLKHWMEKNVVPTAKKDAIAKALQAANAIIQLPPSQIKMMNISKSAREEVMKEYNAKVKQVARDAAQEVIKKALKEGNKVRVNEES